MTSLLFPRPPWEIRCSCLLHRDAPRRIIRSVGIGATRRSQIESKLPAAAAFPSTRGGASNTVRWSSDTRRRFVCTGFRRKSFKHTLFFIALSSTRASVSSARSTPRRCPPAPLAGACKARSTRVSAASVARAALVARYPVAPESLDVRTIGIAAKTLRVTRPAAGRIALNAPREGVEIRLDERVDVRARKGVVVASAHSAVVDSRMSNAGSSRSARPRLASDGSPNDISATSRLRRSRRSEVLRASATIASNSEASPVCAATCRTASTRPASSARRSRDPREGEPASFRGTPRDRLVRPIAAARGAISWSSSLSPAAPSRSPALVARATNTSRTKASNRVAVGIARPACRARSSPTRSKRA